MKLSQLVTGSGHICHLLCLTLSSPQVARKCRDQNAWAQLALGWASGRSRGAPAQLGSPGSCLGRRVSLRAALPQLSCCLLCAVSLSPVPVVIPQLQHPVLGTACELSILKAMGSQHFSKHKRSDNWLLKGFLVCLSKESNNAWWYVSFHGALR